MSFTNSTPNYGLPQYIGTDKPTYLGDMNTAYNTIDTQMKANADAAAAATSTANTAAATATTASTNATTALNTANSAASEAASATSAAASATSTANTAATNASAALRASAANTIENLAPAYDPTLTYNVGDLVTYIDENNSGKLYKCIVAIAAPEAFNINKWDDVTTSEVYAKKERTINISYSIDQTKSYRENIYSMIDSDTLNLIKNLMDDGIVVVLSTIEGNNTVTYFATFHGLSNVTFSHAWVNPFNDDTITGSIVCNPSTLNSNAYKVSNTTNAGVFSYTDNSLELCAWDTIKIVAI